MSLRILLLVTFLPCAAAAQPDDTLSQTLNVPPQQMAQTLLPGLSHAMGLPQRQSVTVTQTDRSALRAMLLGVMHRQYPGDTLQWMNRSYQAIGMLPPGSDLRSAALDLYQGQIAGYYDPALHQMALVRGISGVEQSQVLQHELAHALQDQTYGLQSMLDFVATDDDQALALQAVVEGQAVLAMYVGATEQLSAALGGADNTGGADNAPLTAAGVRQQLKDAGMNISDSELDTLMGGAAGAQGKKLSLASLMVPATPLQPGQLAYLQAQLLFPYQEGTQFIESLLENASFAQVIARTLSHPPRATRIILHPELYAQNAAPVAVSLAHVLALPTTIRVWHTTVGELNVRTLLGGPGVGDAQAKALLGDHLVTLQTPADPLVVWVSLWETSEAAQRFANFMQVTGAPRAWVKVRGRRVGVLAGTGGALKAAAQSALNDDLGAP